jgi:hypothetical protein
MADNTVSLPGRKLIAEGLQEPLQAPELVCLKKDEVLILQKLLKGFVVGPAGRDVLAKLNAVKDTTLDELVAYDQEFDL